MTLDLLDAAFVHRWGTKPRTVVPCDATTPRAEPERSAPQAAREPKVRQEREEPPEPQAFHVPHETRPQVEAAPVAPAQVAAGGIVARLLAAAGPQWQTLADRVESARLRGRRVIGIAGGAAGEGRSTLVECLAATLRTRGREVLRLGPLELAAQSGREPTHDKRIVLVDAGIWFPPGPIRRPRLVAVSLGCDAAILVRRDDRPAPPAWSVALEAIGVEPLGEVISFARGTGGADR